jgi:hypothetical protein
MLNQHVNKQELSQAELIWQSNLSLSIVWLKYKILKLLLTKLSCIDMANEVGIFPLFA